MPLESCTCLSNGLYLRSQCLTLLSSQRYAPLKIMKQLVGRCRSVHETPCDGHETPCDANFANSKSHDRRGVWMTKFELSLNHENCYSRVCRMNTRCQASTWLQNLATSHGQDQFGFRRLCRHSFLQAARCSSCDSQPKSALSMRFSTLLYGTFRVALH